MWRKDQGERANDDYSNFVNRLRNRKDHPINKSVFEGYLGALQAIKDDNLAYKVAFQRALVLAFLEFVTMESEDIADLDSDAENGGENGADEDENGEVDSAETPTGSSSTGSSGSSHLRKAKQFIKGLNELVTSAPQFLDVKGMFDSSYIWQGSLYNRVDDVIDFTLGASNRASHLVFIAAGLALCKEQHDEAIEGGFDSFWEALADSDNEIHKKLWKNIDRKFADEKNAGGRIVIGREEEYTPDAAREEAKKRARWFWTELGMPESSSTKAKPKKSPKRK
jgi:hypothetical protein